LERVISDSDDDNAEGRCMGRIDDSLDCLSHVVDITVCQDKQDVEDRCLWGLLGDLGGTLDNWRKQRRSGELGVV
jgi:hypothetical protein